MQKSRKICILQPGYVPWLGFFDQMIKSDIFVLYDNVQYDKHGWRNRNKIKTYDGVRWLTVPVLTKGKFDSLIKDVRIADHSWIKKHIRCIEQNYSKAQYFSEFSTQIFDILSKKYVYLLDLTFNIILLLKKVLKIQTEIILSSDIRSSGNKSVKVFEITKELGGTILLEGAKGKHFLDISIFKEGGIDVEFHEYDHPIYPQLHGEFVPYMSIIDLIFNCGELSSSILRGEK